MTILQMMEEFDQHPDKAGDLADDLLDAFEVIVTLAGIFFGTAAATKAILHLLFPKPQVLTVELSPQSVERIATRAADLATEQLLEAAA